MKKLSHLLLLLCLAATNLFAADDPLLAAVRAADDERLAATVAADPARLGAILSDQLRYAHSSGRIDSKTSLIESLTSRRVVYESFDYQERTFTPAAPGVVLMTGRVISQVTNAGQKAVIDINFLGVWREEGGRWRFLAWQSSRNPPPAAGVKP